MKNEFIPIKSAESWQLSNPPIFSLASIRASLEVFAKTDITLLREKSVNMTGYLEFLLKKKCLVHEVI